MPIRIFLAFVAGIACTVSTLSAQTVPSAPAPSATPAETIAASPSVEALLPYGPTPSQDQTAEPAPQQTTPTETAPGPSTPQEPYKPYVPYGTMAEDLKHDHLGSAYIPVDSWVYPAMVRLYSLGYVDTMFLGMRPWTRRSLLHMLQESQDDILADDSQEAQNILAAVLQELKAESLDRNVPRGMVYGVQSGYTRLMGVDGQTLRDSFHLGQTLNNDYGRPYQSGFNTVTGFSTLNEWGRFSLHVRGEYQHSPSAAGYSPELTKQISLVDAIEYAPPHVPQATIPAGPIAAQNPFRIIDASLSFHVLGHEISGGKSDAWLGPAAGGAMAWSNNAENMYAFRINRVEPLHVPLLSRVLGPLRYDFFYGSLQGHTYPNHPFAHSEIFSFRPTSNFEFAFQRTIIFGGKDHSPVTLGKFLSSFFHLTDTTKAVKYSRDDPGARFSDFTFSWRLPFVRKYATLYMDSIAHDDVSPISAPRRAAFRTGVYLSQIPKFNKMDFRVEAVTTDPRTGRSVEGSFNYFETIQRQGYTNKGFIMGDWIGREAKGGQAWITYHLSGNEWVQLEYLNKKTPHDFIPGGTTQNQLKATVVKRFGRDVEMNAWVQYERWKAPIYLPGQQSNTIGAFQLTWFPALHTSPPTR
ncbi:MAG: hypothetical protein JWM43_2514 [Acidobacteriaceae bacterium]|nr:hypothetical protein [Acidobacteriaceae bacterium]